MARLGQVKGTNVGSACIVVAAEPSQEVGPASSGSNGTVRFTLSPQEDGTRFIIDHAAVPPEWHDHISSGYLTFYQQPLERYFAALDGSSGRTPGCRCPACGSPIVSTSTMV